VRKIVLGLLIGVLLLVVLPIAILAIYVAYELAYQSARYERDNPDYKYITSRVLEAAYQAPGLVSWQRAPIDTSQINGGDWQLICVIGPYKDPVAILREEAARRQLRISEIDFVPTKFLGLSPVEESEGAISFLDKAGRGKTVLIDGFERVAGQHDYKCYGRDVHEITLPISSSAN
jgi:hypothetical protein